MGMPDEVPGVIRVASLKRPDRSIGSILVEAGRIKPEDAQRIARLQHERSLRFGEAGRSLGLITEADIEFALSRQFDYSYLKPGESRVSEEVVAAYAPFTSQTESLRALRSQLQLRYFDNDPARKALAIVSAARDEGRSFIAANLAVLYAQLGKRTLLVDADMRNPRQHALFGLDNRAGLSAVLSGRAGPETVQHIPALPHLSVLPAGAVPPNPLELLSRPIFAELLHQLAMQLDVILLDSPPAAVAADAQIVAVRAGAALIVARRGATRLWRVQGVSESVVQAKSTIVGSVLNDF